MTSPGTTPRQPVRGHGASIAPCSQGDERCDYCARPCSADDFNDIAAQFVCPICLEDMIYAHDQ